MSMNIQEIMSVLPHRQPFLLIDRVEDMEAGKRITAIKNVTMNEPFFQGHFPGRPIMPGVLIAEALAQTGAFVILQKPEFKGKIAVFTGINNFKFKRQVTPGDTLRLEVELTKFRSVMGKADVCAYVGDDIAAKGEISFAIVDN